MAELNEEERRKILDSPPRGTWALMLIFAVAFVAAWLYLYFGVFMSRGVVN